MALRSGITPSRAQGAIRNVGIKSGLAVFKATALSTVLAFRPHYIRMLLLFGPSLAPQERGEGYLVSHQVRLWVRWGVQ